MTLDYTKMFLIVTEEAVVKGHFIGMHMWAMRYGLRWSNDILWACSTGRFLYSAYGIRTSLAALGNVTWFLIAPKGAFFFAHFGETMPGT